MYELLNDNVCVSVFCNNILYFTLCDLEAHNDVALGSTNLHCPGYASINCWCPDLRPSQSETSQSQCQAMWTLLTPCVFHGNVKHQIFFRNLVGMYVLYLPNLFLN